MAVFSPADLRRIIRTTVGVDDAVDLDGDILDTDFSELGYDSLAVLEITNKIGKESGVEVPDDAVPDLRTPRQLIGYVNERLVVSS